jgi:hypothetical protein
MTVSEPDMLEEKPEMTPREKIAKLAAMSPEEFNRFMLWNFIRSCKEPSPTVHRGTEA